MKKQRIINRTAITLILLLLGFLLPACGATGDDALDKMSAEELAFVEKSR